MNNYKIAIFDMDGTILDTIDDIKDAINFVLAKYNLPLKSKEEVKSYVGNGLKRAFELACPKDVTNFDTMVNEFISYYLTFSCLKTKPYERINEVLQILKNNGYLLAVISNKKQEAVEKLCDLFFKDLFIYQIGEKEGFPRKPDPKAINELLEKCNIKKEDAIYLGDSEVDFTTAKNANIDFIGLSYGFRGEKFLEDLGVKKISDEPIKILTFLIN